MGRRDHAAHDRLADHAQPGPRPVLAAAAAPARHRHQDRARGRVRVQLTGRVQLRRRAPAQRGHARRCAGPGLRAGRAGRGLGGIPASAPRLPGIPGDRCGPRGHRAWPVAGQRRGGRAAVAAQRPDPAAGDLVARGSTAGRTSGTRCRHEHRDRGGRRAQRARRRGGPGRRRRGRHRARGSGPDRRGRALRRGPAARPGARPLLGLPPDGGRVAVPEQPWPGPVRAVLAVGGDRLCTPPRRRGRRAAVPVRRGHRNRARRRRRPLAASVRPAIGRVRHVRAGHHAAPAAGT